MCIWVLWDKIIGQLFYFLALFLKLQSFLYFKIQVYFNTLFKMDTNFQNWNYDLSLLLKDTYLWLHQITTYDILSFCPFFVAYSFDCVNQRANRAASIMAYMGKAEFHKCGLNGLLSVGPFVVSHNSKQCISFSNLMKFHCSLITNTPI